MDRYKVITANGQVIEMNASQADAFRAKENYEKLTGNKATVRKQ